MLGAFLFCLISRSTNKHCCHQLAFWYNLCKKRVSASVWAQQGFAIRPPARHSSLGTAGRI